MAFPAPIDAAPPELLTPREQQIYHYLLTGVSNKRTAYELGISQRTVETHRTRIYRKFGVRSAMQLLAMVYSESRYPVPAALAWHEATAEAAVASSAVFEEGWRGRPVGRSALK